MAGSGYTKRPYADTLNVQGIGQFRGKSCPEAMDGQLLCTPRGCSC
jgi:hypothetical protein